MSPLTEYLQHNDAFSQPASANDSIPFERPQRHAEKLLRDRRRAMRDSVTQFERIFESSTVADTIHETRAPTCIQAPPAASSEAIMRLDLSLKEILDLDLDLSLKEILDLSDDSFCFSNGSASDMALSLDMEASSKKRKRKARTNDDDDDDCSEKGRSFRPYQAGQWAEKFEELCEYRRSMGHCLVLHTYSENLALARWVKRQRYQYKLMVENKQSTLTDERVTALEDIGFVWDSQAAAWAERLNELAEFRKIYLHCNVPSNYSENSQLATWVKCQRRQYKFHVQGKASNVTPLRISLLENMGFEWEIRSYKKAGAN
jgi:hypothetical protein